MDNIGFTEGYIYRVHSISNITTGNISFTRPTNRAGFMGSGARGNLCINQLQVFSRDFTVQRSYFEGCSFAGKYCLCYNNIFIG